MLPRKKATKNLSVPEEGLTKTHFLRRLQEAASASAEWGQEEASKASCSSPTSGLEPTTNTSSILRKKHTQDNSIGPSSNKNSIFFSKAQEWGEKRSFAIIKPDKSMANALCALIQTSGRLYCGKRQQQELLFNMYSSTEYHPKYYSNIKLQLSRINSGRTGQQTAWNLTSGVSIVIHPCFTTRQHKQGEQ